MEAMTLLEILEYIGVLSMFSHDFSLSDQFTQALRRLWHPARLDGMPGPLRGLSEVMSQAATTIELPSLAGHPWHMAAVAKAATTSSVAP